MDVQPDQAGAAAYPKGPAYTVTFTVEVSGPSHWRPDQVVAALTNGVRWAEGQQQLSGEHGGFASLRATEVRRG